MKLYMKQRVFSWGDKFDVADESGNPRYYVEGEVFTWGKKLHIYNTSGQEVAFIRQEVWSWMPRYFVEIGGEVVATVVKEFTFFRQSYRIEGPPWQMQGDFWAHDYVMFDAQYEIMRMSKEWFTWGDSYALEIFDPRNELLCLAVALAVDCAVAQSQNNNS
ncbi:MAG: LURP-one-related family protein [Oscillospiraceae bacterium]|jgi:uncharacterized protein YxjI|nr:LURP-one-related family protein [Oscillospiraceae bacterium]